MIERVLFITWAVWLFLVFVAAFRVFGFLIARRMQDKRWGDGSRDQKPVALVVPVKGFDLQSTPRFFNAIFAQAYSDYRVIVCFESWRDPVAVWLKDQFDLTEDDNIWTHPDESSALKSVTLVAAGAAKSEGQKVHNQRAAFRKLTDRDEIVAFADADILCKNDWLARLVAPINQGTHPLATTYRWLVPKRPTLPNQLASVINGSITTQGGNELTNVLWGGSMALSREVFDRLEVPELLSGSLNDDLRLSKAARRAGSRIAFVRSLILPTLVDFNWRSFVEFSRRQYTQVKFFSPILYAGTNIVLGFYVLGLLSIVAALVYGHFYAWLPIAAAYVVDQFRALARQQVYLSLFPEHGIRRKLFGASWLEHMLTPFWMVLHWLLLASTWTQNRLTWAGIRYRILSKSKTRVLDRPRTQERLPAGAPGLALLADLHDRRRSVLASPVSTAAPAAGPKVETTVDEIEEAAATRPRAHHDIEEIAAGIRGGPPGKTETRAPAVPVRHPGAPSAVVPLGARLEWLARRRGIEPSPAPVPERPGVPKRLYQPVSRSGRVRSGRVRSGRVQSSRVRPRFPRFPLPSGEMAAPHPSQAAPAGTSVPAPARLAARPVRPVCPRAGTVLLKTRLQRIAAGTGQGSATAPRPSFPDSAKALPSRPVLSRVEARLIKTRVTSAPPRGVPLFRPVSAPAPQPSPENEASSSPASAVFAWPPSRSFAARRANTPAGFPRPATPPRSPSISSRAAQSSRFSPPPANKRRHRPSTRIR
ncbi:MAG: glycosyltransferase [Verrucomicrobiales bacterium]